MRVVTILHTWWIPLQNASSHALEIYDQFSCVLCFLAVPIAGLNGEAYNGESTGGRRRMTSVFVGMGEGMMTSFIGEGLLHWKQTAPSNISSTRRKRYDPSSSAFSMGSYCTAPRGRSYFIFLLLHSCHRTWASTICPWPSEHFGVEFIREWSLWGGEQWTMWDKFTIAVTMWSANNRSMQ